MNNAGFAHAFESLFGPPSELIDVQGFLDATRTLEMNEPMADGDVANDCRYISQYIPNSLNTD